MLSVFGFGDEEDIDIEDLKEKALDFNDLELAADAGNGGG